MEYTDLTIVDCNRQHSVQAISGNDENPALYTNELGRGIKLDVGDKVSIQGAYISEIGAGSDTVEFKGESLGKSRTINYIEEIPQYPTTLQDSVPDTGALYPPLINGYQKIYSKESTFTYELKDNETYISNQFYLTVNGESGYVFLPRRFAYPTASTETTWTTADTYALGRSIEQIPLQFASCDYMFIPGGDALKDYDKATGFYRLKSDNARYTCMRRIGDNTNATYLRDKLISAGNLAVESPYPVNTEPCRDTYAIYTDYFKVGVDSGFNSPENIGESITEQLKKSSEGDKFQILNNAGDPVDISLTYTSSNYRPFLCSSMDTFKPDTILSYNTRGPVADDLQGALDYQSNFYNIYCKRPEIRIAGQKCNDYTGNYVVGAIAVADRLTTPIKTAWTFEAYGLGVLKDLFKAQKLYPELFDNENFHVMQPTYLGQKLSVDNVRYLHINPRKTGEDQLGGDNLTFSADPTNASSTKQSVPVFFKFDKENEDKLTAGDDINNLCYGFATNNGGLIELHPELIGGINKGAFGIDPENPTPIEDETSFGYDYSFNAYGSAYACGINGRLEKDYEQVNEWAVLNASSAGVEPINKVNGLLRQNYVGATNPVFEYDSDQSRFYFSGLHSPELAGQSTVSAGDTGGATTVPDNTSGGSAIVYKINKRVNRYTFTPDMKPYDTTAVGKYKTDLHNASRTLSVKNRNISSWSIMDSVGGVYFTDLGYDKEEFSRGLFGILGFKYDQLFSPATSENNRTVRVTPENQTQLSIPTTNSGVVETDTRDFIVNQFGAVFSTNQIPCSSVITWDTVVAGSAKSIEMDPAISQGTSSIRILAENLPRKMIRPYYTIRSDIIDSNHFIGGDNSKTILPVIGICTKQYSGADYFFGSDNEFVFTVTKGKVITSITTSITDPNQTFSRVDNDSAIIYKIQKLITNEEDLISEYLKSVDNKKK
tara:strand:+ start:91 stop:2922 length:2832 start_codon:yes stop_codon:yes gene_type:complete